MAAADPRPAPLSTRLMAAPVLCCGFRPFFLGAALWAALAMALWMAMLGGLLPLGQAPLTGTAWHAHEMVWGFGMAAVAGFLLTAVPEFTATPEFARRDTALLFGLWLGARLLGLANLATTSTLLTALVAALNLALAGVLAWRSLPRLLRQAERPHQGFALALLALLGVEAGFWWAAQPESRWPDDAEWRAGIAQHWQEPWGDRRQEIVLIGVGMDEASLRLDLDACLLTDAEMKGGANAWARLPDPFPAWREG